ncbi:hypothetical protein ACEWY4_026365 [Coilia grayii]|uniref:LRAT domain-containing protein n=1 Tax=Coilia grayii TaxID=363190 RepID=A0ABD1IUN6_9TELE
MILFTIPIPGHYKTPVLLYENQQIQPQSADPRFFRNSFFAELQKDIARVSGKYTKNIINMLEPGDLIEIERGQFSHWAMYAGDDYLIDLTVEGDEGKLEPLAGCIGIIQKRKSNDVVENCKWSKNNTMDETYKPKSPKKCLERAEKWVGKRIQYNALTFNCEHFVKYLRYGKAVSGQVIKVLKEAGPVGMLKLGAAVSGGHASKISKISK